MTIVRKTAFTLFIVALLLAGGSRVLAQTLFSVPSFPSCNPKIFEEDGDKAHYDSGWHEILGLGLRQGADDVYTLESDNYLQCYCPEEGSDGIQTDWWNAERDNLSSDDITNFQNQGWTLINDASIWGLEAEKFLAKNTGFSCAQTIPTPTPTLTPTVTPTVTVSPTITPTPGPESKCYDLQAEPSVGSAPLTVKFTAHADDPATGGKIKEYKFDFGDTSDNQPQVWSQTEKTAYHRYNLSGEYTAKVDIQDNAGNWRGSDDCRVTIKVDNQPKVLGVSVPDELPKTGASVLGALALIPAGLYLRKRFRLV
jgi:hypothetical protein